MLTLESIGTENQCLGLYESFITKFIVFYGLFSKMFLWCSLFFSDKQIRHSNTLTLIAEY